jgi:hypothetical protein
MKRTLLAAAAALTLATGLAGCETATPYQALNPADQAAGGYRDSRLDSNHWRVSFSGNSVTSRETVERYLLYRAAELTTTQGFDWFVTDDKHTDKQTHAYVDSYYNYGFGAAYGYGWRPSWRFHRGYGYGGWAYWGPGYGTWGYPDPWGSASITEFNRYEVSAEITVGKGPKPPRALDAHEVLANLAPGIQRPKV